MLTAYVGAVGGDDPLANLCVGDRPVRSPRPGWALVKVEAATLNHHDLWTLRGRSSAPITPPRTLGSDAAGTVVEYGSDPPDNVPAVGSRVVVFSPIYCGTCAACRAGDDMFCDDFHLLSEASYDGTLAEFVEVPAMNLIPLPEEIATPDAACLPTAYLTAYRMLFTRAALRPGMSVLIQGATGGVATAALVLARAAGARVLVTARSAEKCAFAKEHGADATFVSGGDSKELLGGLRDATDGRGVDVVIETVGEPTWDVSLRAVRAGGIIVVCGVTGGGNPPAQLRRVYWRHVTIAGTTMGSRAEMERLVDFCVASKIQPVIDSMRPLAEVESAFVTMNAGEQRGKLVILP